MRSTMVLRGSAAIAAVAAVAAVSACGTGGSGAASQTHGPGPASPTASSGADALTGKSSGSTPAGSSSTAEGADCRQVTVSVGEPLPSDKTQSKIALTMVNSGTTNCVLRGFPGVRLGGKDGIAWDLGRTDDAVVPLTLAPGTAATSYLTYLPADNASGWEVASLLVTPPNTTDTQAFEWKLGKVVLQDGATHPGTYIGAAVAQAG